MTQKGKQSRRSILKAGLVAPGAIGMLADILPTKAMASSGRLTFGDASILRFLAALEILETDLWEQYNELGGIQDREDTASKVLGGSGNKPYTDELNKIDGDMSQYIHDNTEDEFTHFNFINEYLESKDVEPVSLEGFRKLDGSTATGSSGKKRLTNLMELTIDTSYWSRYRSRTKNPDFGDTFAPVVPGLLKGKFPAIPRSNADTAVPDRIHAIANTAAFHFGFIEQGGSSLYPSLAQRVSNVEVLRILLSIGPTETMHFQVWHDKAGNITPVTDPTNGLEFPDFTKPPLNGNEDFQANLIMPEPTRFLSPFLPVCSIIRPTETHNAATNAFNGLRADGLFRGQSDGFFATMQNLAALADMAQREV
jgi:Ferritin-like domain